MAEFLYTEQFAAIAEKSEFYAPPDDIAPQGYFHRRPIIHRDSPINGGISCYSNLGIVVDDRKATDHNGRLTEAYNVTIDAYNSTKSLFTPRQQVLLNTIMNVTNLYLPYNQNKVSEIEEFLPRGARVSLTKYMLEEAGVCLQEGLLSCYLIEQCLFNGILRGNLSFDRNYNLDDEVGHAWARYTDERNIVHIVDSSKSYAGKLDDIPLGMWDIYARPEDKKSLKRQFSIAKYTFIQGKEPE